MKLRTLIRSIAILVFCCFSLLLPAQDFITKDQFDKKTTKIFERALSAARGNQLEEAVAELDKLIARVPHAIDAIILRADVSFDQGNLPAAELGYEQAIALSAAHFPMATYRLAVTEFRQQKFTESMTHFRAYQELAPDDERRRARIERYLADATIGAELIENPVPFDPVSVGEGINTPGKEYLPSFTADGRLLVYTVNYNGQEDFFYSTRDDEGNWTAGQPLPGVNTRNNEGAQSIAADGKTLVFTSCQRKDGYGSCDLYISYKVNGQWTPAENMGDRINSRQWDTQPSLSANGRWLYFASNRPGGVGKSDIWRSQRLADGSWSLPENLGPPINTPNDDEAPFLHADGQTLYFMSKGHSGLGEFDLFYSRRTAGGQWGAPHNLGYPINTTAAEGALVVSLDGKTAYYTTDKNTPADGPVNLDIYQFPLYPAARPQAVTYLEGLVIDADSKKPLSEVAVAIEPSDDTSVAHQVTTDSDGRFLLVLPAGQDYAFRAQKEGYLFFSDRFVLGDGLSQAEPYQLEIPLQLIPDEAEGLAEEGAPVVLRNVLFASGSAELLPESSRELDVLAALLLDYPDLHIRINGHTDNVGEEMDNLALSEARARAVYDYLVEQEIAPERLAFVGFGESRPIATNDTAAGRALNRRTEFEVIGQEKK